MKEKLPNSVEYFFDQVLQFLKVNGQGDMRCMVIVETSAGQFWTHSMVNTKVWELGMLETAKTLSVFDYQKKMKLIEPTEVEKQILAAEPTKGKAN